MNTRWHLTFIFYVSFSTMTLFFTFGLALSSGWLHRVSALTPLNKTLFQLPRCHKNWFHTPSSSPPKCLQRRKN